MTDDTLIVLGGEWIEHFGVKGMKWGVRKERARALKGPIPAEGIKRTTANGDQLTLAPIPATKLHKVFAGISQKYADQYSNGASLKILDREGKRVGQAQFWMKGKDDIYLNWLYIQKSARGRGYASEVMKAAAEHGKKTGRKRMVLEVPGNAPDARHIYEKLGFKATRELTKPGTPVWDGLTEMEYRFDKKGRAA